MLLIACVDQMAIDQMAIQDGTERDHPMGESHTTRNPRPKLRKSGGKRRCDALCASRPAPSQHPRRNTHHTVDGSYPGPGLDVQSALLPARSLMPSGVSPFGKTPMGVVRLSRVS